MRFGRYMMLLLLSLISSSSFAVESDWTGFYVGGNVGESINTSDDTTSLSCNTAPGGIADADYISAFNTAGQQSLDFNNFIAGVQTGYDYQIHNWVIGIETSYDPATQATGSQSAIVPSVLGSYDGLGGSSITQSIYESWDFTVRPQVGYAIDSFLFYATGGFALTKINYTSATDWNNVDGDLSNSTTTMNQALPGWAAGAGIGWKFKTHYSVTAEYRYEGFEHFNQTTPVINELDDPGAVLIHKGEFNANVLTVGINYTF